MTLRLASVVLLLFIAAFAGVACGDGDGGSVGNSDGSTGAVIEVTTQAGQDGQVTGQLPPGVAGSDSTTESADSSGVPGTVPITPEQIIAASPNELGQVPILEYHHIGDTPEQFVRTPEQFRGDLQWLYDHNFHVINLHDFLAGRIDVPAGKRPVMLTFDDSPASQFRLVPLEGNQYTLDPNSAIGMLEAFFGTHPDFGRGGHFSVLPDMLFDWTPASGEPDQADFGAVKMKWLRDHGYEIGNHTRDHANLAEASDEEIEYQLAEANIMIHSIVPDVPVEVITLPYGTYPVGPNGRGDEKIFRGFDYKGQHFSWSAALMVGANPTVVPYSTQYEPYAIARIQAFDDELDKWFGVFESDPGILYVSDGDPNTVTVPNNLHPWLVGTLDESSLNGQHVVRY